MKSPIVVALAALAACGDNKLPVAKDAALDASETVAPCAPVRGTQLRQRKVGSVSGIAVHAASPPGDRRLFVVVREGTIQIFDEHEQLLPTPFIDLSRVIYLEETVERGLLGLAFHPQYATNRQFFVFYTTQKYSTVARCLARADDRNRAEPTCTVILEALHDRAGNHNGGMIDFGPDGYLYIGTGDGGGAGDPDKRAQDPSDLLGKILRIDVDHTDPGLAYAIPADNPYAAGGGRGEVYIRGLRNPWRWSFDRATGDLWIGDVGQNRAEELDVLRPGEQRGANLGWSLYEGNACCADQADHCLQNNPLPCDPTGLIFPKDVRDRETPRGAGWAAIVGGQTYRGACFPDLVGDHFYTDTYVPILAQARLRADGTLEITDHEDVITNQTSSIAADSRGELYLIKTDGGVFQLEAGN